MPDDLTPNTARELGVPLPGAADEAAPGLSGPSLHGIHHDMTFEEYLSTPAISKSRLWTLHTRSPAHSRIDKEESNAMKLGTAIHCAVLEPDEFEARFKRGPTDKGKPLNKNTNAWKEWVQATTDEGFSPLDSNDYDAAVHIRDEIVVGNPLIRKLTGGGTVREVSAFWQDEPSGLPCRLRMDAFAPALSMGVDLKVTTDARPEKWFRRVLDFGYHVQETHYTEGWRRAGGDIDAFVFLVIEDKPPFAHAIYELTPPDIREGEAIRRAALTKWAECVRTGEWPGYPPGVQQLALPKWAFTLTNPEEHQDE